MGPEPDVHVFEHARAAEKHTLAADLQGRIRREQIRQVVPLRLVDVVAIGVLHDLDIGQILQALDAIAEAVQLLLDGPAAHLASCACDAATAPERTPGASTISVLRMALLLLSRRGLAADGIVVVIGHDLQLRE